MEEINNSISKDLKNVCIGLIQHDDDSRNIGQELIAEQIAKQFESEGISVFIIRAKFQTRLDSFNVAPPTKFELLSWSLRTDIALWRETNRRRLLNSSRKVGIFQFLSQNAIGYFRNLRNRSWASKARVRYLIDPLLADKHIYTWTAGLNNSSDVFIILENDCLIRDESSVKKIINLAKSGRANFIDLAGGFSHSQLGFPQSNDDLLVEGIISNTTCAYLMDKNLAEELLSQIIRYPNLRQISIGFLINSINYYIPNIASEMKSLIPHKTPLVHGTISGEMQSSIPY